MSFRKTVPSSVGELSTYMHKIHDNKGHVKKVEVNPATGHLEVTLDGMAHFAGNPDVYLPIKRGKIDAAKNLIERMMRQSDSGFPPSDADVKELFDMIDPAGQ
jgi:hypothetical protein